MSKARAIRREGEELVALRRTVRERAYGFALALYVAQGQLDGPQADRVIESMMQAGRKLYGDEMMFWAIDRVAQVALDSEAGDAVRGG